MFELAVALEFWFWFFVVGEIILLFVSVSNNSSMGGAISLAVFFVITYFVNDIDYLAYVQNNPIRCIVAVLGYFGIGIAWAVFRWYTYCVDRRRECEAVINKYGKQPKDNYYAGQVKSACEIPNAGKEGDRIRVWIGFWWISIIYTVCADWVFRIVDEAYHSIKNFLQSMADRQFKNLDLGEKNDKDS